jgi:4-amino-4-deoxy-L-arabinose transferase-like glycosyltransferase
VRRWGPTFLAAVAVRIAYWVVVQPHWIPDSDADQYDKIARSLANGTGYGLQFPQIVHHPTAFRPPLLPLLLTPGHWLFGEALWPGRLLSVILGSTVVVLAGVLAARIGGRRAGYLAALVVMFSPPLLANDTITLTEPLALLLGLAAILLLTRADTSRPASSPACCCSPAPTATWWWRSWRCGCGASWAPGPQSRWSPSPHVSWCRGWCATASSWARGP